MADINAFDSPVSVVAQDQPNGLTPGELLASVPLTVVGAADSVVSSLSFGKLDPNLVSETLLNNTLGEKSGLHQLYQKHEEGYKFAGDMLTLAIGTGAAMHAARGRGLLQAAGRAFGFIKDASAAGEFGGYIAAEGNLLPSAVRFGGQENLDVLRHMFKLKDAEYGAAGVKDLLQIAERRAALTNIARTGALGALDEAIIGEAATLALLNQSTALFPEGMNAKEYLMTSTAFAALGVGGSLLRTTYGARRAAEEASLLAGRLDVARSTPTASLDAQGSFKLSAQMDELNALRSLYNEGNHDVNVQSAILSRKVRVEESIFEEMKTQANKASDWTGVRRELTRDQIETLREASDGSAMRGIRTIRNSEELLHDLDGRRSTALKNVRQEIADLKAKSNPTMLDEVKLQELRAKEDDIRTMAFTHVMADGTHMVDGEAPVHLGWRDVYSGKAPSKSVNDNRWHAGQAKLFGDSAVEVLPDFTSSIGKPLKADLRDVNKQAMAYQAMLKSDQFAGALSQVKEIDISKLSRDPMALQAILGHADTLKEQELQQFLGRIKMPEGVKDMTALKDWALAERMDFAMEFLADNAKQRLRLRKTAVEPVTPYELSMRTGLQFHDQQGVGTPLFDMLQGLVNSKNERLPNYARSENAIRELMANAGSQGRTTDPEVISRIAGQPIDFNMMGYKWRQKPVAIATSQAERDATAALDAKTLLKVEKEERLHRLEMAEGIVTGADPEATRTAETLVQKLLDSFRQFGPQVADRLETAAAGIVNGQHRQGPFAQAFMTRAFQTEEVLGGKLAKSVSDALKKVKDDYAAKHFEPVIRIAQQLNKLEAKSDQLSANMYLRALGLKIPVKEGLDAEGRILVDTTSDTTAKIFKNLFGMEVKPGATAYLPNPIAAAKGEYVPLRVTEGARPLVDALGALAEADLHNRNQIRFANKQNLIQNRPHYLPHVDYDGQHMRYIANEHGRPVAMVVGTTAEDAQRQAKVALEELASQNKASNFAVISNEDIVAYKRAHGEQAFDQLSWADKSMAKGRISELMKLPQDNSLIEAYVRAYSASLDSVTRDTIRTMNREAINALHFNAEVAKPASFNKEGLRRLDDSFTLFEEALLGKQATKPGSWTAVLDQHVEELVNPKLQRMAEFLHSTTKPVFDTLDRLRGKAIKPQEFAELGKKLAAETGYKPFDNALEYAAVTTGYKPDANMKQMMLNANGHAAYMMLGFLEPANGIINAISPFAMGPAHMRLFKRMKGESEEMYRFRVGDVMHVHDGVGVPMDAGLMFEGMRNVFSKDFRNFYERYTEKPAVEGTVATLLSGIHRSPDEVKSLWSRAFSAESGWATAMSRRGDQFGQELSHSMAYQAMKRSGLRLSDPVVEAYTNYMARKLATQTRPEDRGDFFKTAVGIPFGLFQSYANNYIQNLAQMIERGDTRALFMQYAYQALMFGMQSVPGWQQLNDHVFRSWDGKADIETTMKERLGRGLYDVAMNGPLWSVPKIFGADGIGIYTRGDANFKPSIGQIGHITDLPSIAALGNIWATTANAYRVLNPLDNDPSAWEALVRSTPNRTVRGWLENMQGYSTDKYGQMTFDRTQDWGAMLYRFAGVKTMTEIEAAKASWHLKGVDAEHKKEIGKLRVKAMAAFRNGNYDALNEMALDYIKAGGNPSSYTRWFNDTAKLAREVRSDRELEKALEKATSFRETTMLMDAMTSR